MTPFQELLEVLRIRSKARKWVGERTLTQAWTESQRGDWWQTEAITEGILIRALLAELEGSHED